MAPPGSFRWRLADPTAGEPAAPSSDDPGTRQLALFGDEQLGLRWSGPTGSGAGGREVDPLPTRVDLATRRAGTGEFEGFEFLHVHARRIINTLPPGSRAPHRHSINAYRGCSHACVYCFARPTHEYLGLNMGEDFDRRIVVKVNAVDRVRAEVRSPRWSGEAIAMGTNTDPYQRCEGKYHLTRGIIEVLAEEGNPFSILTKSTLVLRDLDLLAAAARRTTVYCNLSIGTLDGAVWRATEPGTPHPRQRLAAVRKLADAGITTGVLMGPVIPGLSDAPSQLAEVVDGCLDAGASSIIPVPLHLRPGVRQHFLAWLQVAYPALGRRYVERFEGAYLPAAERERICRFVSDRVADRVDGCR